VPDVYGGYDLRNRNVLSLEWKNDGVMDDKSGDDDIIVPIATNLD